MTRLDLFLDRHPKLSKAQWWLWLNTKGRWRELQSWREQREWKPGSAYLDHGYEPCILIEIDYGALTGVSLVDGRLIGGCDIHACGPERVSLKEARTIAEVIKKMKAATPKEE